IKVEDDGSGVSIEDIDLLFLPHSTSKISKIEDLFNIKTLGFRGEALFSIASVAKIEFITKKDLDYGIKLSIYDSQRKKEYVAANKGTTIKVIDLFYNTPVRKKFLKSPKIERLENRSVVEVYASIYNEIEFEYFEDGNLIYRFFPESRYDRINKIFGIEKNIGELYLLKKTEKKITFINNRPANNKMLISLVNDYLERYGLKSGVMIFVEVSPTNVDFNIHPRKLECRFKDESKYFIEYDNKFRNYFKGFKVDILPYSSELKPFRISRTLWQANTDTSIIFFDQHAVFERITYEKYMSEKPMKQQLLVPIEVKTQIDEYDAARLEELGFEVRIVKGGVFVKAVPAGFYFDEAGIEEIIKGIKGKINRYNFALLACRYSVKSSDEISPEVMKEAIKQLFSCIEPKSCPHGRPTFIEIKLEELTRKFERH
ncbi:MAG: DNA mismatch repair endonuclease MutL, partial [bacterium]|nr:DNA mismatch repair endonuclease MutL [bacterium]